MRGFPSRVNLLEDGNMELAPVSKRDLKALAELVRACSPELDFVDDKVLDEQSFNDPNYEISFLVQGLEQKKPVAFILGVTRKRESQKIGHIKFFGVHPKFRGRRFGHEIFSEIERRFQKREVREIHIGECPAPYLMTGVTCEETEGVCFLLGRGYERQSVVVDMVSDLGKVAFNLKPEQQLLVKEAGIHKAKTEEREAILAFAAAHFPGWAYEMKAALEKGTLMLAGRDKKITAFSACDGTNPGFFGPMGTLESERGKGLGQILMVKCLEAMKKAGHKKALIPWVGPIPFYVKFAAAKIGPLRWHFMKRV
jgi:ribosomal protein S18 acetylase RimI-like enzyme